MIKGKSITKKTVIIKNIMTIVNRDIITIVNRDIITMRTIDNRDLIADNPRAKQSQFVYHIMWIWWETLVSVKSVSPYSKSSQIKTNT